MKFWEWVQYTVWDVRGRLGDADADAHAQALWDVTHSEDPGDREINRIVDSQIVTGPRIPFFSDLADTLMATIKGVGGVAKLLPYIVVAAIAFLGVYLVLMGRKGKAVL